MTEGQIYTSEANQTTPGNFVHSKVSTFKNVQFTLAVFNLYTHVTTVVNNIKIPALGLRNQCENIHVWNIKGTTYSVLHSF